MLLIRSLSLTAASRPMLARSCRANEPFSTRELQTRSVGVHVRPRQGRARGIGQRARRRLVPPRAAARSSGSAAGIPHTTAPARADRPGHSSDDLDRSPRPQATSPRAGLGFRASWRRRAPRGSADADLGARRPSSAGGAGVGAGRRARVAGPGGAGRRGLRGRAGPPRPASRT